MRPSAFVLICALGCTPQDEAPSKPPPRDPATAPAPVELEPAIAEGPEYLLGVAGQSGIRNCPRGSKEEWINLSPRIGLVGVSGPGTNTIEGIVDRPVLARGSAGPRPDAPPLAVELAPCPEMQMRSDWIVTPSGIMVDDGSGPGIDHFSTTSVRPLDELTVRREAEEVVVEFRNPLPFAIDGVGMRMRYEGCYGKPGSTTSERAAAPLAVGATRTERFPIYAEVDADEAKLGRRYEKRHAADSIALIGSEGSRLTGADANGAVVYLDLDAKLSKLGADVECPED